MAKGIARGLSPWLAAVRQNEGASAVEFAMVLPVMLTIFVQHPEVRRSLKRGSATHRWRAPGRAPVFHEPLEYDAIYTGDHRAEERHTESHLCKHRW